MCKMAQKMIIFGCPPSVASLRVARVCRVLILDVLGAAAESLGPLGVVAAVATALTQWWRCGVATPAHFCVTGAQ